MLGDLIMLIGAICLGFYEVVYKMSLPEGHGGVVGSGTAGEEQDLSGMGYEAVRTEEDGMGVSRPPTRPALSNDDARDSSSLPLVKQDPEPQTRTSLPLALHANFLTSLIGVATLVLFWIPIPLLHWTGLEEFALPYGHFGLLAVICTMGATYVSCGERLRRDANLFPLRMLGSWQVVLRPHLILQLTTALLQCLIGLLGPVTASVANLLAIGLVALIDAVYLARAIPFWTLCGAGLVAGGFAVLLYQGEGKVDHERIGDVHHAKDDDEPDV